MVKLVTAVLFEDMNMKICLKCKVEKEETEFNKNKYKKDGLQNYCKVCQNILGRAWREANPNKVKEVRKAYREANPNKVREASKAYYKANPNKVKEAHTAWLKANPDKVKEARKAYFKNNPEKASKLPIRNFCAFVIKPFILERDYHQCQLCACQNKLKLHHILPVQHDSDQKHILNPKNLVILCKECHHKIHNECFKRVDLAMSSILLEKVKKKEKENPTILPEYLSERVD